MNDDEKLERINDFEDFLGTSIAPISSIKLIVEQNAKTRTSSSIDYKKNVAKFVMYDEINAVHNVKSSAWKTTSIDMNDDYTQHIYVHIDCYKINGNNAVEYIGNRKATLLV